MKRLPTLAIILALACGAAVAQTRGGGRAASSSAAPAVQDTLIRNATVLTVSRGTLTNTDVLLRGGKIAAVGQNLKAPDGARPRPVLGRAYETVSHWDNLSEESADDF